MEEVFCKCKYENENILAFKLKFALLRVAPSGGYLRRRLEKFIT